MKPLNCIIAILIFSCGCTVIESGVEEKESVINPTIIATINVPGTKMDHALDADVVRSTWNKGDTITIVAGREVRYYVADESSRTTTFHMVDEYDTPFEMFETDSVYALVGKFNVKDYCYALTNASMKDYLRVQNPKAEGEVSMPMDYMRAAGVLKSGVVSLSFSHILSYFHLRIPKELIVEHNYRLHFHTPDRFLFWVKNPQEIGHNCTILSEAFTGGGLLPKGCEWDEQSKEYEYLLLNIRSGRLLSYYNDDCNYSLRADACILSFSEEDMQGTSDYVDVLIAVCTHNEVYLVNRVNYMYVTDAEDWSQPLMSKFVHDGELRPNSYYESNMEAPYVSKDFTKDGSVRRVQQASEGQGIDIIFMADGYSDRMIESGLYENTMEEAVQRFFEIEPYKSFRNCFNIYYVTVISNNEVFGDTKLQTEIIETRKVRGDNSKCFEYAQRAISEDQIDDAVLVVTVPRNGNYGTAYLYESEQDNDYGSGASIAYVCAGVNDRDYGYLIHHEAGGHAFGKLHDEYIEHPEQIPEERIALLKELFRHGWYRNVDFTDDPSNVKWSRFILDDRYQEESLGIYEGALYGQGIFRPSENSVMVNKSYDFYNAPSREAIYYRINKLAYGDDWQYDYESFVSFDINSRGVRTKGNELLKEDEGREIITASPVIIKKTWREEVGKK